MAEPTQTAAIDPARQQIGTVYAKALLGAAEKAGQSDQVVEELGSFVVDVLDKLPKFQAALSSPRISHEEKTAMLDRALAGKMTPLLLNFLKVVSRHSRLDCLRAVAVAARNQLNEMRGRVEVLLKTAAPISNTLREQIVQQLTKMLGKEIVLRTQLDPEMLGGLIVRVGDTVFDGSLTAKLTGIREAAVEKTAAHFRQSLERFALSS
jgi:F-type H+-transporting ATPase subunit delta